MRLLDEANRKWWTLAAVTFSLFMIMLDNTVVGLALPTIDEDLGVSFSQLEWTVNAYILSFAVLLLTGGKLADFLGRRRIFLTGLVVFTISSLACALAVDGTSLIAARAVQGVGAAFMLPASLSIIAATFPPHQRGAAIGIWAGVSGLALAIGPFVGGFLIEAVDWRAIFYLNIPIGIIGLAAVLRFVSESRDTSIDQRLDLPGLATSGGALVALTFALVEGHRQGWGSPLIVLCFVGAAVGLAAFVALEHRGAAPMLDLSFFRNGTFAGANAAGLLLMLVLFAIVVFFSIFLQDARGYSPLRTGLMFTPMTILVAAVSPVAGRLTDRTGARIPMVAGIGLTTISLFVLSRFDLDSPAWQIVVALGAAGAGFGFAMVPMTAAVLGSVPPDKVGVASGVLSASRHVGGTFGVAIAGAIIATRLGGRESGAPGFPEAFVSGAQDAFLVVALLAAVATLVSAFSIGRHRKLSELESAEAPA